MSSQHDYEMLASLARDKARFAMHQGNPVSARTWIQAAAEAERAMPDVETSTELRRIADTLERIADLLTDSATIGR